MDLTSPDACTSASATLRVSEAAQPAHGNGVWGRIGGQNLDADAGDRFSAATPERTFFAQFGKDCTLSTRQRRRKHACRRDPDLWLDLRVFQLQCPKHGRAVEIVAGTVETQAQSIGGYWTRYQRDGSYFDGVGQLTSDQAGRRRLRQWQPKRFRRGRLRVKSASRSRSDRRAWRSSLRRSCLPIPSPEPLRRRHLAG